MIIAAFNNGETRTYTKSAHQFDKGQKLIVTGIAFPDTFEIHMSNQREGGMAYSCKGNAEGILIPDALFVSGDYIYAWLYATATDGSGSARGYDDWDDDESIHEVEVGTGVIHEGETVYEIIIPVVRRPVQLPTMMIDPAGNFGYTVDENETLVPVSN